MRISKSQNGFTLLELLIASSLGLVVILTMTSLFKMGMDATFTVTQRAETQQNMRAAIELMTKDISLAGGGLPSGGLQLVTGGTVSKIGCNQTGTCYLPAGTYPNSGGGVINYMYGIIPGFNAGVENGTAIPAAPGQINSSITSIYCDYNFPLSNFTFTFPTTTKTAVAVINGAVQPNNILAAGGLLKGDLLLFTVNTPGNGKTASGTSLVQNAAVVAEITNIPSSTEIDFTAGDPLNFNQSGGGIANNLATVAADAGGAGAQVSACRLNAVSYFLQVPPAGGTVQTPRLMRQVNGLDAVPVADNIINLQFTYDVIDSVNGTVVANQQDPIGAGESPGLVQKVNIWIMGSSLISGGNRSQSMYLATSVSTRDMSFCNSYSATATVCQ
ncbi:MAG TPA: prepilin-type N-terminal cleavage/methylation domain-containing protein [Candidatus Sulfotelmatobacter sp.]|jgi:prepilin-type N-terminal cleavage/methylation domain-containing protein|nr:prepilin-type N-terminal cleavage/methylation domain-containing protein [Candidatus Sulfotelmatobacter sp.]